jgi:uncharacterized phage-associated protein
MDKKLLLIQRILKGVNGGTADKLKIYKLMYFIDFEFYNKYQKSISNSDYYNWQFGPLPYKDNIDYNQNNLIEKGVVFGFWKQIDGEEKYQVNQEKQAKGSFLPEEELVILEMLDKYGKLDGKELVDLSHGDMPWKMTKDREKIEYEYVKWRETEESKIEDITQQVFGEK